MLCQRVAVSHGFSPLFAFFPKFLSSVNLNVFLLDQPTGALHYVKAAQFK